MTYSSSNLNKISDLGIGNGAMWRYLSSDAATDLTGVGAFAGAGYGSNPAGSSIAMPGMKLNDTVIVQESSAGVTPGRATVHGVKGSTASNASTLSSTGFNTVYNVSLSTAY